MNKFSRGMRAGALFLLSAATAVTLSAQTFNSLHSFDGTDGASPYAPLIQATDGNLYGTTQGGGANGWGTIFKITPSGTLTTLYSFCSQNDCTDGTEPFAGLVQGTDGNLYGTTHSGGTGAYGIFCAGCGTVFKITPSGRLTTLYSFCSQSNCTDGAFPYAGLVQATNGDFYGTTTYGAVGDCEQGCGTVFKITPNGKLTTLYSFCSQGGQDCTDGANPRAGLIQATNGDLYGTTDFGGANTATANAGTIFRITPSGTLTTLYSFCPQINCPDGSNPYGGLVQATNGDFYGTTSGGGANINGGTVFRITPSGTLTTLYSFCSKFACGDGDLPQAGLVQATDGNLYGTTAEGGANEDDGGTVFKITLSGKLTRLYTFCSRGGSNCTDGLSPDAALVQDTNGTFYGTTETGGANHDGTVFSLSIGLAPFVETLPASGEVGTAVKILGTDLTGTTSVNFNGTAATFTVVSSSEITTSVPIGATTGNVQVATPKGTLTGNVLFQVR